MRPAAAHNRQAVPRRTANLPSLPRDVRRPLAAMRKEDDKNPAAKPAQFPRAVDRWLADEFARAIAGHTIPARSHRGEICRAERTLRLRGPALRHQFLDAITPVFR